VCIDNLRETLYMPRRNIKLQRDPPPPLLARAAESEWTRTVSSSARILEATPTQLVVQGALHNSYWAEPLGTDQTAKEFAASLQGRTLVATDRPDKTVPPYFASVHWTAIDSGNKLLYHFTRVAKLWSVVLQTGKTHTLRDIWEDHVIFDATIDPFARPLEEVVIPMKGPGRYTYKILGLPYENVESGVLFS
jgi:hypothetical protein